MEQTLDEILRQWHVATEMTPHEASAMRVSILTAPQSTTGLSVAWWQSVLHVSGMWNGPAYSRAVAVA